MAIIYVHRMYRILLRNGLQMSVVYGRESDLFPVLYSQIKAQL
jgi:hypothetical protein